MKQTEVDADYLYEMERDRKLEEECSNCQGENLETGYVELWDGVCPDCGRKVN